jgi:glycosyltransferase involved in cell wall biosynthesis
MSAVVERQTNECSRPAPGRLRRVLYAFELEPRKLGSMEEQVALLGAAFQARDGFLLPVFTAPPAEDVRASFKAAGVEIVSLNLRQFRFSTLARLLRLISRERIEVIHWNFFGPLTNGYVWALTMLKPWVQHYFTDHNSRDAGALPIGPGRGGVLKWLFLKRYARVIGVSQFVADCLRAQAVWPEPECLLHFINTERFAPDAATRAEVRTRLGVEESRFVLLCTGYLIRAKGIDVALRALRLLPETELWVVGDGAEMAGLQALSRELGVEQRVRFLGLQSRVDPFMQAADCFVCPSRWAEAAGLVNIEAQACGLPVVASRIGGIPEYVADGQTGLLFAPESHEDLARAIRRLLDDRAECVAMGRRAREWAVQQFSPAARLDDFLDLYREKPAAVVPWRNT